MITLGMGCGSGLHEFAAAAAGTALRGAVHGGQQPISGASVQLYAMGQSGNGSASTPLLSRAVQTDVSGGFNIPGQYSCPSATTQVYVVAFGGNPGLPSGVNNAASGMLAALGPCGALTSSSFITVNEATTVGSLWPLAAFAASASQIGSSSSDASALDRAVGNISFLVNISNGAAPGPFLPAGMAAPVAKLNTLADILAACVNSGGGTAGDGTPCGNLFSSASTPGSAPPSDTISAAISIANHPTRNVDSIFSLTPASNPFQPMLTYAPADWTLATSATPAAPVISPGSGTLTSGQTIAISTVSPAAQVRYTLDGSTPSASSDLYSAPIAVTKSLNVRAIAMLNTLASDVVSASYTVLPAATPSLQIVRTFSSVYVGGTFTGTLTLSVAPTSALTVIIASGSPAVVAACASVVVQAGNTTASFTCTALAAGTTMLQASAAGYTSATVQISASVPTLRQAAALRGFLVGAAADADELGGVSPLVADPQYGPTLAAQYNMLEPENAMKWIAMRPGQSTYNFEPGDALVTFAQANQMKVRGHTLVWGEGNPAWLTNLAATASPASMSQVLQQHIQTVVSHYKGKVFAWDVVNEAIDDAAPATGTRMKDSIWYNKPGIGLSGTGYVESAFRWAHAADPDALLFYNDYNIYGPSQRFSALLNMLKDFLARGVPISGVGLEMHTDSNGWPDTAGLVAAVQQITALGLQVHITEMDVALPVTSGGTASAGALQAQAQTYKRILTVCLQNPGCTAFQTWGFTDKRSWIPASMPGYGAALPMDANYQPKPAFSSIMDALMTTPAK